MLTMSQLFMQRCFNQQECSKWITAILECLSRDIKSEFTGKKIEAKHFKSQQNLNTISSPQACCTLGSPSSKVPLHNHSWENIAPKWIVNHDGRILLELNYLNCHRAKLPIANQTAKILKNVGNSDVIHTTKKINFIANDDENNNRVLKNANDVQNE